MQKSKKLNKIIKIVIAIVIVVCFVVGAPLIYNKNYYTRLIPATTISLTDDQKVSKKNAAINQFMQELIKAIDTGEIPNSFYENLPLYKNKKPTFLELQQYIQILSDNFAGKISSFTPMSKSNRNLYHDNIVTNKNFTEIEKNSIYYWLEIKKNNSEHSRFPILIMINEQNQPTLEKDWIASSYRLYSYAKLYFNSIKNNSDGSLSAILKSNGVGNPDLLAQKITMTKEFYGKLKEFNPNILDQLKLSSLRGDSVEFEQVLPNTLLCEENALINTNNLDKTKRYVQISLDSNNSYHVFDVIPEKLSALSFTVFQDKTQIFALKQPIDNFTLKRILGNWTEAFFYKQKDADMGDILITYDDIELTIRGEYDNVSHKFSGNIISIKLKSNKFNLADGVEVGAKIDELLLIHPFIDLNNNTLSFINGNIKYSFDSSNHISSIELTS